MQQLAEITKELFNAIITSDDSTHDVRDNLSCTEISYYKHGVMFIKLIQASGINYYIQDINA